MNNTQNGAGLAATPKTVIWLQGVTIGWMLKVGVAPDEPYSL